MDYIQICEWDKFQHYKKRNPPWVKLYAKILDDDDFDCLPDDSKLLFFCLLPFASRRNNKVRLDFKWLQKKMPIEKTISNKTLQPLIDAGFIEVYQDDSIMIDDCAQDATPETEAEKETKTEAKKKKHIDHVYLSDKEHQTLIDKFGKTKVSSLIEDLDYYIGSKGKRYKSHYKTILAWEKRNGRQTTKKDHQQTAGSGVDRPNPTGYHLR